MGVRPLTAEPNNPSLIPKTHYDERKLTPTSCPLTSTHELWHKCEHKQTINKCNFETKQIEKDILPPCLQKALWSNVLVRLHIQPLEKAGIPASALAGQSSILSNTVRFQSKFRHLIKDMKFEAELYHIAVMTDRKLQCGQRACLGRDSISFSSYHFIPS